MDTRMCFAFPPPTKNIMIATGAIRRIEPKSGCIIKSTMMIHKSAMYGKYPLSMVEISERRRFRKYAKYRIAPSFMNSTG